MANQQPTTVWYREYLITTSDALDCYVTIERFSSGWALTGVEIVDEQVATIDELVTKLDNELDDVTVVRSSIDPDVIHLIETALTQNSNYVMDQQTTIAYTGTLHDLLEELSQKLSGIGPRTRGMIPIPPDDFVTETSVNMSNKVVRDILTDAVPLQGYKRIVFEALTHDRNGSWETEVRYTGPEEEQ